MNEPLSLCEDGRAQWSTRRDVSSMQCVYQQESRRLEYEPDARSPPLHHSNERLSITVQY